MTSERETSCEDFARRFDGFLDGEMDAHSLRALALHAGQCRTCSDELERAERLQQRLFDAVQQEVDRLEPSKLWQRIEAQLEVGSSSLGLRLRESLRRFASPLPALALGGALAALIAAVLWPASRNPVSPESAQIADNHAQIERIESNASHVAVWSEPAEHTTAIWVASYEPEGAP